MWDQLLTDTTSEEEEEEEVSCVNAPVRSISTDHTPHTCQVDEDLCEDDNSSEGEVDDCDNNNIDPQIGMRVAKMFVNEGEGGDSGDVRTLFSGTITSTDVDGGGNDLYHVVYDDGDEEDLNLEECRCACMFHINT